jgi:hypothetical protein
VNRAGPSTKTATNLMPQTDEGVEVDRDGDGSDIEVEDEGEGDHNGEGDGRRGPSTSSQCMQSFEDIEADDKNSEMGRSDILLSPPTSDEEDGRISSHPDVEFHEVDLVTLNLKLKMKNFKHTTL